MKAFALSLFLLMTTAFYAHAQGTFTVNNNHDCDMDLIVYCTDNSGIPCPSCSTTVCISAGTTGFSVSKCDAAIAGVEIFVTTSCGTIPCTPFLPTGPALSCMGYGGISMSIGSCCSGNINASWLGTTLTIDP